MARGGAVRQRRPVLAGHDLAARHAVDHPRRRQPRRAQRRRPRSGIAVRRRRPGALPADGGAMAVAGHAAARQPRVRGQARAGHRAPCAGRLRRVCLPRRRRRGGGAGRPGAASLHHAVPRDRLRLHCPPAGRGRPGLDRAGRRRRAGAPRGAVVRRQPRPGRRRRVRRRRHPLPAGRRDRVARHRADAGAPAPPRARQHHRAGLARQRQARGGGAGAGQSGQRPGRRRGAGLVRGRRPRWFRR